MKIPTRAPTIAPTSDASPSGGGDVDGVGGVDDTGDGGGGDGVVHFGLSVAPERVKQSKVLDEPDPDE